jgi:hypothetical protein
MFDASARSAPAEAFIKATRSLLSVSLLLSIPFIRPFSPSTILPYHASRPLASKCRHPTPRGVFTPPNAKPAITILSSTLDGGQAKSSTCRMATKTTSCTHNNYSPPNPKRHSPMSSHYTFPIFVSSTAHNLVDLRAELRDHLTDLGYQPILSTEEGFRDHTPHQEAWESCLEVIEHCYVLILILDGRYGKPANWPNYSSIIGDRKVSPTHGEFLYARHLKKRMLVFVRQPLWNVYDVYRTAKAQIPDSKKLRQSFFCPPYIDFNAITFLEEIKTGKPVCWIREFKDVTEIKREVQRQLLNELAQAFQSSTVQHVIRQIKSLGLEDQRSILGHLSALSHDIEAAAKPRKRKQQLPKSQVSGKRSRRGSKRIPISTTNTDDVRIAEIDEVPDESLERMINNIFNFDGAHAQKPFRRESRARNLGNPFLPSKNELSS